MRAFFTFSQQKTQVLANYEYAIERIDLDQEKQDRVKTCVKTALNNGLPSQYCKIEKMRRDVVQGRSYKSYGWVIKVKVRALIVTPTKEHQIILLFNIFKIYRQSLAKTPIKNFK